MTIQPPVLLAAGALSLASGAASVATPWPGGPGHVEIIGTFAGGSTLQLEKRGVDGTTWVSFGTPGLFSANGLANIDLPACYLRLKGGVSTTSAIYATVFPLRHWS